MTLRQGVRLTTLQPQILLAMFIVDACYTDIGVELVVTSENDALGEHMKGSLHEKGLAFDCRTQPNADGSWRLGAVPMNSRGKLVDAMRARLGDNFQVIVENDHLHVEASPILAPGTK